MGRFESALVKRWGVIEGAQLNRRQLLNAELFSVSADLAREQELPDRSNADTRPGKGEEELWFLHSALDTLIFAMTDAVMKEPNEVARTIQELQRYGAHFGNAVRGIRA